MKRMLFIAIILTIFTVCCAQEINSFRHLSTSGALDDDLEYVFSPLDLYYLNGTKLFSNLSNFDANDQIFMTNGGNYLLLGAASDKALFQKLKAAFLFKYYVNKFPLQIDCSPEPNIFTTSWGEVEYDWQSYYDTNNNGLYDRYRNITQKYKNLILDHGNETFLTLAYELTPKKILGYKIGYLKSLQSETYANSALLDFNYGAPTTDYYSRIMNLPDQDPTATEYNYELTREGDFNTEVSEHAIHNEFGYMQLGTKRELSCSYVFRYMKMENITDDQANRIEHNAIETTESESAYLKSAQDGLYNELSGRARFTLVPDQDRKKEGFVSFNLALGILNLDAIDNDLYQYEDYAPNSNHHTILENLRETGDISGLDLNTSVKFGYPLNKNTFFGTGLYYHFHKHTQDGDFNYSYSSIDTLFNTSGAWNSIRKETSISSGKTKHVNSVSSIRIPVGLEYWFSTNQKWAMRFGSVFTQVVDIMNDSYRPTLIEPTLIEIYYPNQTNPYVMLADNSYLVESHSIKTNTSATDFSYGLCYKANNNLQVELMSMFDQDNLDFWNTSFFRNLKLSFTISF
ncbi:MAG: hypothetical protein Q8M98_05140 [Candidatus Cloacimonadaceae bacterium]|nr:hypothetical protein [Candidatus Cloacimonadaceae bacterium]